MTTAAPSRAWTITLSHPAGQAALTCSACRAPVRLAGSAVAQEVRRHLVHHVLETCLPPHLRTCQCREHACVWHRRQARCAGPLRLVLIRADHGRRWHLADACATCAAATPEAATVTEPPERPAPAPRFPPTPASAPEAPGEWVESW